jgi:hypothetical protein
LRRRTGTFLPVLYRIPYSLNGRNVVPPIRMFKYLLLKSISKTYSVSIKSAEHSGQKVFQESDYFKEKAKERYKIEANSELKQRHGYDAASTSGLLGMQMQGAVTIFTVNLKRIMKLMK